MKHHLAFFALCGTLLTAGPNATAQVFIPDTLVRNWLNADIPGIVDVSGIMDTSHVGIATLDSATWNTTIIDTVSVDLTGVQYLDSLRYLHVHPGGLPSNSMAYLTCPSLPRSLLELRLTMGLGGHTVALPDLRAPLKKVTVMSGLSFPSDISIASMQDTLASLALWGVRSLDWGPNTAYIEDLQIEPDAPNWFDTVTVSLPGWRCDELEVWTDMMTGTCILDLDSLWCNELDIYNGQSIFQSWPEGVRDLHVNSYNDAQFPPWPGTVQDLWLQLPGWSCIPPLPNGLQHLNADGPYCIPNIPDSLTYAYGSFLDGADTTVCSILNADCPGVGAALAGRLFIDNDADGILDPGEAPMPWSQVHIQPNNSIVSANSAGWWERGIVPGSYIITPATEHPHVLSMAPLQHSATFGSFGEVDSTNHFGYALIPNVNDLHVDVTASPARPGFNNQVWIRYRNEGSTVLNADLTLTFDSDQSWVGSTPAPSTQSSNTATWDLPNLPVCSEGTIPVTLHTNVGVPIGTSLLHLAVIDPLPGDTTPANNTITLTDTVVGSYDPNDKLLDTRTATLSEVLADDLDLTYTIRFQNTGTFQAERVVIVDTLSDQLQWSSFQFLGSSHTCDWYMLDGVLHFIFDPILLPDSGSNEAESHGFVRFSMRPSTQLQLGETVSNIAHIVFDFNEPIVTPPAVFIVDNATGVLSPSNRDLIVMPNPTRDRLRLDGFSGTARYRIRDIGGRIVQRGTLNGPGFIEVAVLSPGTYFLEVEQNAATRTVRFVRER